MDVSVVVATRNRAALLPHSLRSALRQRHVSLEIIVVDDASTDDTSALVRRLHQQPVRLLRHEKPRGVSAARNTGAAAATGDWLAFLDDDDLWAPDKLRLQLEAARGAGREWAYSGAVVIDPGGLIVRCQQAPPPEAMVETMRRSNAVPGGGSNVIVHRRAWERVGPFDTRLRCGEDWELYLRLTADGLPAAVDRPLLARRLHDTNATLDLDEVVRGTALIESMHDIRVDWGLTYRWMAHSCLRAGRSWQALRFLSKAAFASQLGGVAGDLAALARERLGLARPAPPPDDDAEPDRAEAAAWLRDLATPDLANLANLANNDGR